MAWTDIISDPEFQMQPANIRARVAANYFRQNIATEEYLTQPPELQRKVKTNFYATLQEKPEFKAEHPYLYAAGMTALGMPGALEEVGRKVVSGATLGLSEKVGQAGEWLAGEVTGAGERPTRDISVVKLITGEKPESLPSYVAPVAEMAGAFAPISKVAQGIDLLTKGAKLISKSKYAEPLARVLGWTGAGSAYDATRYLVSEGELPEPKEVLKSGVMWGGIEAIISSLGWGGRLTIGVNRLAKLWGISKKEALDVIIADAKKYNAPFAHYARDYSKLQKNLKEIGNKPNPLQVKITVAATDFVNRVDELANKLPLTGKQGTPEELASQLSREGTTAGLKRMVEDARIASFGKEYIEQVAPLEVGGKMPYREPEKLVRTALSAEVQRIIDTPSFLRTAEDKIALQKFMQEGQALNIPGKEPLPVVGDMKATGVIEPGMAYNKRVEPPATSGGKQSVYKGISREGLQSAIESGHLEPQYERWPGEEPSHYFTTDLKAGKDYAKTTATGGESGELLRIKSTKAKFEPDPEGEKGSIRTFDKIPIQDIEIFKNGKWSPVIKSLSTLPGAKKPTMNTLNTFTGGLAGVETDEQGNITFDPTKAAMGMALGFAGIKLMGAGKKGITLSRPAIVALRNEARAVGKPFIDYLATKGFSKVDRAAIMGTIVTPTELFNTLKGVGEKTDLPKYAGSINLTKQNIPEELKQFEAELADLMPKTVQTWDQTGELADKILDSYELSAKVLNKARRGSALNTEEILAARKINVNAIGRLKEMMETLSESQFDSQFAKYQNDIFKTVSNASSEAGRALNIHKQEVSINRMADAFAKLRRGLNDREKTEFKALNLENPLEVKRFIDRLGDPKLMDYVYEYWYNSILSGIPTHVVNVASNTLWGSFQLPHRALVGGIDKTISMLTGKKQEIFASEVIPMLAGYKSGFGKGAAGALEMARTGKLLEYETKWEQEVGKQVIGAFERSPNAAMRAVAPFISAPTRALRAMDVWANSIAYDAQIGALIRRKGLQAGLRGEKLNKYVQTMQANPNAIPQDILEGAAEFAKYSTFMDDPGKFSQVILKLRNIGIETETVGDIKPLVFVVPFVNIIGNLLKRGVEMTPGAGLLLSRGNPAAETIAKQVEGLLLGGWVVSKVAKGEITGNVPEEKNEREAFYRDGKLPWSIKLGDTWHQCRRIEPYNTVIAASVIAYEQIKNAKDSASASDIAGNLANSFVSNLLDSSYLQGVTNALDKYGKRKGMLQRTAASFVPFSGFTRSINRAIEAGIEGHAKVRESSTMAGTFSQVIPFMYKGQPVKLDVFGEEKTLPGGFFRQWSPYKFSEAKNDPVERELVKLEYFPGLPDEKIKIAGMDISIPPDLYRKYVQTTGKEAKVYFLQSIKHPEYQSWTNEEKKKHLVGLFREIRDDFSDEVKARSFWDAYQKAKPELKKVMETKFNAGADSMDNNLYDSIVELKPAMVGN